MRGILVAGLLWAAAGALAQAPAPAVNTPTQATVPATTGQGKGSDATPQPERRTTRSRPGEVPPPANIRIQGDGIKMPKCASESRDGEACKK